jgi:hypothetical protein
LPQVRVAADRRQREDFVADFRRRKFNSGPPCAPRVTSFELSMPWRSSPSRRFRRVQSRAAAPRMGCRPNGQTHTGGKCTCPRRRTSSRGRRFSAGRMVGYGARRDYLDCVRLSVVAQTDVANFVGECSRRH